MPAVLVALCRVVVQKRPFSGNTRDLSADPDRSRVGSGLRDPRLPCRGFSSARTACTPGVPAGEHAAHPSATPRDFCRPDWGLHCRSVSAVVQEELKHCQVVLPQLPPWEEVVAQPAVEVLDRIVPPVRSTPTFHRPSVRLAHLLELGRRSLARWTPASCSARLSRPRRLFDRGSRGRGQCDSDGDPSIDQGGRGQETRRTTG